MANSEANTNGSQFFITFRSCGHLDGKHAVFGRVIDGLQLLDKLENIETERNDKPKQDIIIEETIVLTNPYRDAILEILMKEWEEKHDKLKKEKEKDVKWTSLSGLKNEGN